MTASGNSFDIKNFVELEYALRYEREHLIFPMEFTFRFGAVAGLYMRRELAKLKLSYKVVDGLFIVKIYNIFNAQDFVRFSYELERLHILRSVNREVIRIEKEKKLNRFRRLTFRLPLPIKRENETRKELAEHFRTTV